MQPASLPSDSPAALESVFYRNFCDWLDAPLRDSTKLPEPQLELAFWTAIAIFIRQSQGWRGWKTGNSLGDLSHV